MSRHDRDRGSGRYLDRVSRYDDRHDRDRERRREREIREERHYQRNRLNSSRDRSGERSRHSDRDGSSHHDRYHHRSRYTERDSHIGRDGHGSRDQYAPKSRSEDLRNNIERIKGVRIVKKIPSPPHKYNTEWKYGYTLGPSSEHLRGNYTTWIKKDVVPEEGEIDGESEVQKMESSSIVESELKSATEDKISENVVSESDKCVVSEAVTSTIATSSNSNVSTTSVSEVVSSQPIEKKDAMTPDLAKTTGYFGGKNPIQLVHEAAKIRKLTAEWEQVKEEGPAHQKVFVWTLKIGQFSVEGRGNSKKNAKIHAAEQMAVQIKNLPRPKPVYMWGRPHNMAGVVKISDPSKKKIVPVGDSSAQAGSNDAPGNGTNTTEDPQANSISKLYEHLKHRHKPDPKFTVINENILDIYKTPQGFTIKKIEYTMQCEVLDKKYEAKGMTKKAAKHAVATLAWTDINPANQAIGDGIKNLRALSEIKQSSNHVKE